MKTHSTKRNREKGAAMLESALIFLTMMSMIIFIIDMGRILLVQQFITERARTTVRSAVVNNWTSDETKNYLVYNSTSGGTGSGYFGLTTSEVSYQTLGSTANGDSRLQVKVSNVPALTWVPFISGSYTLPSITVTAPVQSQGSTN